MQWIAIKPPGHIAPNNKIISMKIRYLMAYLLKWALVYYWVKNVQNSIAWQIHYHWTYMLCLCVIMNYLFMKINDIKIYFGTFYNKIFANNSFLHTQWYVICQVSNSR